MRRCKQIRFLAIGEKKNAIVIIVLKKIYARYEDLPWAWFLLQFIYCGASKKMFHVFFWPVWYHSSKSSNNNECYCLENATFFWCLSRSPYINLLPQKCFCTISLAIDRLWRFHFVQDRFIDRFFINRLQII